MEGVLHGLPGLAQPVPATSGVHIVSANYRMRWSS